MIKPFEFDYLHFQNILRDAGRLAFKEMLEKHEQYNVYAIGLEAHTQFESLYPFILTESDLHESALDGLTHPNFDMFEGLSLQDVRDWMRYGVPDRDYEFTKKYFRKVHRRIHHGMCLYGETVIHARKEMSEMKVQSLMYKPQIKYQEACILALQELDKEETFGNSEARKHLVLFLKFTGHANQEEGLEFVTRLNPILVVNRYKADLVKSKQVEQRIQNSIQKP